MKSCRHVSFTLSNRQLLEGEKRVGEWKEEEEEKKGVGEGEEEEEREKGGGG